MCWTVASCANGGTVMWTYQYLYEVCFQEQNPSVCRSQWFAIAVGTGVTYVQPHVTTFLTFYSISKVSDPFLIDFLRLLRDASLFSVIFPSKMSKTSFLTYISSQKATDDLKSNATFMYVCSYRCACMLRGTIFKIHCG